MAFTKICANTCYRPQRSCGQGNVFTGVCLSTGGEGVCLSACWDARPPWTRQTPPDQADTPLDQADPPDQADTPGPGRHPQPGRYPPRPSRHPPRPGRHPPDQADTPLGSRLQHTVYERPVRILLELHSCMESVA